MDLVVTFKIVIFNLWKKHIQSFANLPKSMWKLVFNVIDVIFHLEVLKIKPTKSKWIMTYVKLSKTYAFGILKLKNKQKLQLIWTYENIVKF
jgi:hypothetical protein